MAFRRYRLRETIPEEEAFREFVEYCKKHYRRRYRVTLAFDMDNLRRAWNVYRYAIYRKLTLYRSILELYGYRYRRMENFIKELGIWKPGKGWVVLTAVVKVTVSYTRAKRNTSNILLEAEVVTPFPFEEFIVNVPYVLNLVIDCLERNEIFGIDEIIGMSRIDAQFKREYKVWELTDTVTVSVAFSIEFERRVTYHYDGECMYEVPAFVVGGIVVGVEKP